MTFMWKLQSWGLKQQDFFEFGWVHFFLFIVLHLHGLEWMTRSRLWGQHSFLLPLFLSGWILNVNECQVSRLHPINAFGDWNATENILIDWNCFISIVHYWVYSFSINIWKGSQITEVSKGSFLSVSNDNCPPATTHQFQTLCCDRWAKEYKTDQLVYCAWVAVSISRSGICNGSPR